MYGETFQKGERVKIDGYGHHSGRIGTITEVFDDDMGMGRRYSVTYDEQYQFPSDYGLINGLAHVSASYLKRLS